MRYMGDTEIYMPCEENYKLLREKTPGGQSLIITMEALAGITKIHQQEYGENALTCQSIFSLDASLMYGFCMKNLPVGHEILRRATNGFRPEYTSRKYVHYQNAERIISYYVWKNKLINASTYLRGGEWRCRGTYKHYQPDCVAEQWVNGLFVNQVILEIYGDAAHCCPIHNYPLDSFHFKRKHKDGSKMTYGEVAEEDEKRIQLLKYEFGVDEITIIYMCEFHHEYESNEGKYHQSYLEFLQAHPQYDISKKSMSENELLQQIFEGKLHGFLHADFESTPQLIEKTELFPLLFHKANISRKDTGPIMNEYLEKMKILRKPRLELISSHKCKGLLVATNLVQFYMEMGVKITNVERLIQFDLSDSMYSMVQKASDLRYKATNNEEKVLGNLMKTLVVSCYGKFLLNPKNFTRKNMSHQMAY